MSSFFFYIVGAVFSAVGLIFLSKAVTRTFKVRRVIKQILVEYGFVISPDQMGWVGLLAKNIGTTTITELGLGKPVSFAWFVRNAVHHAEDQVFCFATDTELFEVNLHSNGKLVSFERKSKIRKNRQAA